MDWYILLHHLLELLALALELCTMGPADRTAEYLGTPSSGSTLVHFDENEVPFLRVMTTVHSSESIS